MQTPRTMRINCVSKTSSLLSFCLKTPRCKAKGRGQLFDEVSSVISNRRRDFDTISNAINVT